jgi:DNA-binding transcriptional LysR family regulator
VDRLRLTEIFIAVAEEQSFARGARRLGISPPAATRAIVQLEERLSSRLLMRTTRYVRTTEAGQRFLDDARRVVAALDEAEEAVTGESAEPRGHLSVTAPVLFGRMHVAPGVVEFLKKFPAVTVSTLFLDRVVNLLEEDIDVGVRIGELPDSSLHAVRVGQVRRVLCASPAYLRARGHPQLPQELVEHELIVSSAVTAPDEWKFSKQGKPIRVRATPRLTVNNNDVAIEAALAGLGITRLLSYQVAQMLRKRQLVALLDDFDPDRLPVHVIYREGRYKSGKLRAFIDLMVTRLRANPSLL